MIEYIINNKSNVLHKRVHGRTHETCNIDQIKDVTIFNENQWPQIETLVANKIRWCKRCQPNQ